MSQILFILNHAPYGTEHSFNALRLAGALLRREQQLRVFLMADAVLCAHANQKLPSGHYNLQIMLSKLLEQGAEVSLCGSCMEARGIGDDELIEGARRGTLDELADWTLWADKVIPY